MVSRIPGARKSENEARTRARILRGTAHGKIPVLRQTTRCQGRARDAAAPPRPASPRFPETPRPGFLGLPPGSGRARRSGPERAGRLGSSFGRRGGAAGRAEREALCSRVGSSRPCSAAAAPSPARAERAGAGLRRAGGGAASARARAPSGGRCGAAQPPAVAHAEAQRLVGCRSN